MCERVPMEGGGFAIVCRGHRRKFTRCHYCERPSEVLCDAVNADRRSTCDRPCCRAHAKPVGPNKDHCIDCAQDEIKAQRRLAL